MSNTQLNAWRFCSSSTQVSGLLSLCNEPSQRGNSELGAESFAKCLTGSFWPLGLSTSTSTVPRPALKVSTVNRAGAPTVLPWGSSPVREGKEGSCTGAHQRQRRYSRFLGEAYFSSLGKAPTPHWSSERLLCRQVRRRPVSWLTWQQRQLADMTTELKTSKKRGQAASCPPSRPLLPQLWFSKWLNLPASTGNHRKRDNLLRKPRKSSGGEGS